MTFPVTRPRRLRRREGLRRLVRETSLDPAQLVLPLFVVPGSGVRRPLQSLPGVAHVSPDEAAAEAARAAEAGVGGVLLFGLPATKDERGLERVGRRRAGARGDPRHPRRRAGARHRHRRLPVRLHHPRPLRRAGARRPRAQRRDAAAARQHGGRPRAGRRRPDRALGHDGRPHRRHPRARSTRPASPRRAAIMAYSTKFASAFYGPFREAADSAPGARRPALVPDGPRPTPSRACASRCSTSTRAPTC